MISEEFYLIGIIDENSAKGIIRIEDLRMLLNDFLQIPRYYPILIDILEKKFKISSIEKRAEISIIFQALDDIDVVSKIPDYYNNRMAKWTIKLIKAAIVVYSRNLLNFHDIREAANIHQLKETELITTGIPCDKDTIESMLRTLSRTITTPLLEKWISLVSDTLEVKGTLMAHEFLYLVCNTHSKKAYIDKIPKVTMDIKMDPKFKIFHIEDEFLKSQVQIRSSDERIKHLLNSLYSPTKAKFEGKIAANKTQDKLQKGRTAPVAVRNNIHTEQAEYKKLLKSAELTIEIKQRLRSAKTQINWAKNPFSIYKNNNISTIDGKDNLDDSEKKTFEISQSIIHRKDINNTMSTIINNPDENCGSRVEIVRNNPFYLTSPKIRPKSSLPNRVVTELKESLGFFEKRPGSAGIIRLNSLSTQGDRQESILRTEASRGRKSAQMINNLSKNKLRKTDLNFYPSADQKKRISMFENTIEDEINKVDIRSKSNNQRNQKKIRYKH